ncbi:hypothetical protein LTR48_004153 [Friedmanniomyces endolithicus]|uniref:Uncharacterized protein n=1 Tax=Rachicladosporium monterosium TaxID=1507873 RepID=A0ABR0L805_9PEZI|nr:hypothetical protein LTR29_016659 [Friedmanniomyces endolithicus]KAK1092547.1 hypothetical protein LTR48_004153 [Friedmanniomyces endolithicus]KAK5144872.1 hypothetical protein LTR32_003283 [Rachicladosporium monterosium]
MGSTARSSEYLVHHATAESLARGGFCGDITHVKPINITECSAQKMLVLYMSDASYSIVHGDLAPWEIVPEPKLASPLVLPSCEHSSRLLALCLEDDLAEYAFKNARMLEESKAAAKSVDGPKFTSNLLHQDKLTAPACLSGTAKKAHNTSSIKELIAAQPDTDVAECIGRPDFAPTLQEKSNTDARASDSESVSDTTEAEDARTAPTVADTSQLPTGGSTTRVADGFLDGDDDWVEVDCDEGKDQEIDGIYVVVKLGKKA